MKISIRIAVAAAGAVLLAGAAQATVNTVFNSWSTGASNFDATVTAAGGTVNKVSLPSFASSTAVNFGAFTVTRNNGGAVSDNGIYTAASSSPSVKTSGHTIDIDPSGTVRGINGNSKPSGVTLTFASAVNSIGFEVGDWGTCCQPSALYISFDNGAPIQVGVSNTTGDVFLTNKGAGVFVAALDDSSSFSKVQFWGDGFGEYLVMGGTVRYALVNKGTLPPQGVPEPASWAMFIGGFGAVGGALRRRRARIAFA